MLESGATQRVSMILESPGACASRFEVHVILLVQSYSGAHLCIVMIPGVHHCLLLQISIHLPVIIEHESVVLLVVRCSGYLDKDHTKEKT